MLEDQVSSNFTPNTRRKTKARDKVATGKRLEDALLQFEGKESEITISAVARLVGVSPSAIHHVYPKIAERIRRMNGRTLKARLGRLTETLRQVLEVNGELRHCSEELEGDLRRLASINYSLTQRLQLLEAEAAGAVTRLRKDHPPHTA